MRLHASTLLALLLACGGETTPPPPDAGPVASDYDGTWLMTSMTLRDGSGTSITILRDGSPTAIRGDAVWLATTATTATLDVRQALTTDGLLASDIMHTVVQVMVEPDRWVLTASDGVSVFVPEAAGDHLVITSDPSDPRHTAPDPPSNVVLDRVAPWPMTFVGGWTLLSMQLVDRTIMMGACTDLGSGQWGKIGMEISIDNRLRFEREMTITTFSDDQCTAQTGAQGSVQRGMAEDADGKLQIWGIEEQRAEYQRFAYTIAGNEARLSRIECLPMPACVDEAPLVVTMRRH
jgi:hypothetical protein